jgi:phosphate transport system permease protein
MSSPPPPRREIARSTLLVDRLMNRFIKVGGISIIAAVFGIFVFILAQILPLFGGAKVGAPRPAGVVPAEIVPAALGADEWLARPFVFSSNGACAFLSAAGGTAEVVRAPLPEGAAVTAFAYEPRARTAAFGLSDGACVLASVKYEASFAEGRRTVAASLETLPPAVPGTGGVPVRLLAHAAGEDAEMLAVVQRAPGGADRVFVASLVRKRTLLGRAKMEPELTEELTDRITGEPVRLLVNHRLDGVLVLTAAGHVHYFYREGGAFALKQTFRPFTNDAVASMDFLFGDDSVVFTGARGAHVIHSLYVYGGTEGRKFGLTKTLPPLPGGASSFAPSLRNKAFLVASGRLASLRFGTTADVRWEARLDFEPALVALGEKYDALLLLGADRGLRIRPLRDPHPEAGLRAFFGRVWYEGSAAPKFAWQSTAATDDFEPKLSMVPLLAGTLKGTLYAMLFSLPLAVLAALYTSQFAHPDLRRFIKPTMEIMASLPSVILGFLAAIWLAPILETRVPSFLLALAFVPAACALFGAAWSRLPFDLRRRLREGREFLVAIPLVLAAAWLAWQLGPWLERVAFVATDPATGRRVADFRLWWPQVTGLPFEQRNSLVVGFMMGFAVIPIVFTITEDALSNVPASFRSASLALGASRWQTALRVMLPTASAGIFSAAMIGFGRAVGETMIVLMATGNTPVTSFNVFSGMRTLSANIAVELPEAPAGGTLFRALYLGAMLLFLTTFAVNTLAELLRHHLREKFKAV